MDRLTGAPARFNQPRIAVDRRPTEIVSIEHFGASADFKTLFREFGITADAVVAAAQRTLENVKG